VLVTNGTDFAVKFYNGCVVLYCTHGIIFAKIDPAHVVCTALPFKIFYWPLILHSKKNTYGIVL
jgi:hypothetical protein